MEDVRRRKPATSICVGFYAPYIPQSKYLAIEGTRRDKTASLDVIDF